MDKRKSLCQVFIYILLVFTLSTVFYVLIICGGGLAVNDNYVMMLMWAPAFAGIITTLIFQRNLKGMGWKLGRFIYYPLALLLPIVYAGLTYGVIWLTGAGTLDIDALGPKPMTSFLFSMSFGLLTSCFLALGEEIGWRGSLVPQLAKRTTFFWTALISGVIWGIWHIPLIIGGGYSSGAPTWFAIICFMFDILGMSFAFAWIRMKSGSFWPAVLLHATHNTFIQSILDRVTINSGHTEYYSTEFGLGLAIMGVIVAIIFWKIGIPQSENNMISKSE